MAIDEGERQELEEIPSGCIGERGTSLLMNELPPQGWHDFATKSDLGLVQQALQTEMRALGSDLRRELADLRAELTGDLATLSRELTSGFAASSELHRWVMWQFVATSAVIATALSIYHFLTG